MPHLPSLASPGTPPCFPDGEEFSLWLRDNRRSRSLKAKNFCQDCTPMFKRDMIEESRCLYPETEFHPRVMKLGDLVEIELIGVRPPV